MNMELFCIVLIKSSPLSKTFSYYSAKSSEQYEMSNLAGEPTFMSESLFFNKLWQNQGLLAKSYTCQCWARTTNTDVDIV